MENNLKVYQNFKETDLHFAFVFASPLVIFREAPKGPILQPLLWDIDFEKDQRHVENILSTITYPVKYASSMASIGSFATILNKKPMILHFCGHGVENTKVLEGLDKEEEFVNNDYLLFEDKYGRAEVVSCDLLKEQIRQSYKGNKNLEFVFVASCHSEVVGEVFLHAGASHVLCVKRDEKISDEICNQFTELFYTSLFKENMTFCEAFDAAKMKIKTRKYFRGEERKFVMLTKNTNSLHQCTRLLLPHDPSETRTLINLSERPTFRRIPSKVDCFRGRKREIYEVSELLDKYRFVLIKGMMGIGKSSLAKEYAVRAINRNIYKDGVLYVNMRGKQDTESFFSLLRVELNNTRTVSEAWHKSHGMMKKDFNEEAIIEILRDKEAVLIVDNIDAIKVNNEEQFYIVLMKLMDRVAALKVLMTSFGKVEHVQTDFALKIYEIGSLTIFHTCKLFIERAPRMIEQSEIDELFKNYPTKESKKGGRRSLIAHPLLKFFDGHPQTILIGASLLATMNLSELFKFYSESSQVGKEVNSSRIQERQLPATIKASLKYAIEIIQARGQRYYQMFGLLSLFPGGVSSEDLSTFWKEKDGDVEEVLKVLVDYSAAKVKQGKNKKDLYFVNRLLAIKAQESLPISYKKKYTKKITEFYLRKLEKLFCYIGSHKIRKSHEASSYFLSIERNVKLILQFNLEIKKIDALNVKKLVHKRPKFGNKSVSKAKKMLRFDFDNKLSNLSEESSSNPSSYRQSLRKDSFDVPGIETLNETNEQKYQNLGEEGQSSLENNDQIEPIVSEVIEPIVPETHNNKLNVVPESIAELLSTPIPPGLSQSKMENEAIEGDSKILSFENPDNSDGVEEIKKYLHEIVSNVEPILKKAGYQQELDEDDKALGSVLENSGKKQEQHKKVSYELESSNSKS